MKKIAFIIISCLCLLICNISVSYGEEKSKKSNLIYVVYDDSRSMYCEDGIPSVDQYYNKWGIAKYSISAFVGMMNKSDTMKIYSMSQYNNDEKKVEDPLVVKGNMTSQDKATYIKDNLNSNYAKHTEIQVVKDVAKQLKNDSTKDVEKWLVVITDGIFLKNDKKIMEKSVLKKELDSLISEDFNCVYLSIGDESIPLDEDVNNNFYTYSATDNGDTDILKNLTKIANLIFEHQNLNKYTVKNDKVSFTIDAPIKKIIIFSQGEEASISKLVYKGKKTIKYDYTEEMNIEGTDKSDIPNDLKEIFSSRNEKEKDIIYDNLSSSYLHGIISTCSLENDEQFELGEYELEVSNSKELNIYYELDVDLKLNLYQLNDQNKKEEITSKEQLSNKELYISSEWINRVTQEKVESSLINEDEIKYNIVIDNNGKKSTYTKKEFVTDKLNNGTISIIATATLPDKVSLSTYYESKVYQIVKTIQKFQGFEEEIRIDEIADNPITLTIIKENGELFTEEEWNNLEVEIENTNNLDFKITRNSDNKTYTIQLESASNGRTELNVNVEGINDTIIYKGNSSYEIKVRGLSILEIVKKYFKCILIILSILALICFILYRLYRKKAIIPNMYAFVVTDDEGLDSNGEEFRRCKLQNVKHNTIFAPRSKATASMQIVYIDHMGNDKYILNCNIEAEKREGVDVVYITNVDELRNNSDYSISIEGNDEFDDSVKEIIINSSTTLVCKRKDRELHDNEDYKVKFVVKPRFKNI